MSEIFLYYALLTSVFLLSGVLIVVIQYLFNVLKKNKLYQKDAVRHSQEIISHANEKAKQIISEAQVFSDEVRQGSDKLIASLKESQREELKKAADRLFEEYKAALEEVYKENINIFRNISKDIEEKAGFEIRDFKEILEKETIESQKIVGEKIETEYHDVQKEIQEYKNRELLKVQKSIYGIVHNAIELAIGKSLDRQTQEELVMEALKEAIEKQETSESK